MLRIILAFVCLWTTQFTTAKDIKIESLINRQSINCEMPNPMINFINDVNQQNKKHIQVNKALQTVQLDKNKYLGVQGYQHYKTKNVDQDDFAVNTQVYGVKLIKIALQGIRTVESESGAYYFIFEGKPSTVMYHIRKAMANDWNIENTLEETPQGNSKLVCVYAG